MYNVQSDLIYLQCRIGQPILYKLPFFIAVITYLFWPFGAVVEPVNTYYHSYHINKVIILANSCLFMHPADMDQH